MNVIKERLYNGMIKENPIFVMMLGMCPTLAVTTSCINGIGMGLTTLIVLALSNFMISLLRMFIPDGVRVPSFIVVVASFVTIVQFLLEAYLPALNESLGIYIPLIVVNCIILGRAESYAYKNGPIASLFDGIGMGLGFTMALGILGAVREIIGSGALFGHVFWHEPVGIFALAPGAFFVLALLVIIQNKLRMKNGKKPRETDCDGNCRTCGKFKEE